MQSAGVFSLMASHWLANIAVKAGYPKARDFQAPKGAELQEIWSSIADVCGVGEEELTQIVAKHMSLKVADLRDVDPQCVDLIPEAVARKYQVLPLKLGTKSLHVAASDPLNLSLERSLAFASGRDTVFELAPPASIGMALEFYYSRHDEEIEAMGADEASQDEMITVLSDDGPEEVGKEDAEAAPVIRLTNLILRDAIRQRASDIHLEPASARGLVRFRVDGVMRNYLQLPLPALNRVVSRIKILADMDIADRLRPQDGRARIKVEGVSFDLRVSTVPTRNYEKLVIRVLDSTKTAKLGDIGMPEPELSHFRSLLNNRDSIVVVTGPTGSGKTTTLYAALQEVATSEVNVMTVEDPVEYELAGITQIQVESKRGVTFASALRAILRQDPDVILVGEIRDLETAEVAVQASMTGHLVLATLHTNDAASVITRLTDIGLDRPSVAASLKGAIAQRLLRKVCVRCSEDVTTLTEKEEKLAARLGVRPKKRAVGCHYCENSGYYGRTAVNEVLRVTSEIREMIVAGATPSELTAAASERGMRSMFDVAVDKVSQGITTLDEVERVLGEAVANSAARAPETKPVLSLVPTEAPQDTPRIVIVDANPLEGTDLRESLAGQGFPARVSLAADASALEIAGASDITFVDVEGGDAQTLLSALRAHPNTSDSAIIALGEASVEREIQCLELGADDYVCKPFVGAQRVARIRAAMRRAA